MGEHAGTIAILRQAAPDLARSALDGLTALPWFARLSADVRSRLGVALRLSVDSFVAWLEDPDAPQASPAHVFDTLPAQMASEVTLQQTVEVVRVSLDSVATAASLLAPAESEDWLRASTDRFGREIAFSTAAIYARAAEVRGSWDARLQSLVIDALLAGDPERVVAARASSLGWPVHLPVRGAGLWLGDDSGERALRDIRHGTGRHLALAGLHGSVVLAVIGCEGDPLERAAALLPEARGVVVGPEATTIRSAGDTLRAALSGITTLPAWRGHRGPLYADEMLAERALAGDAVARAALVDGCFGPLRDGDPALLETVDAVIDAGGALQPAARALPVHVNTLRYRLGRVAGVTGQDLRDPRGRFTLQVALILGRMRPEDSPF